ncbi:MAG: Arginase [Candidatus Saccharibacteria bacterium]|nr:Arginase [Candidatus Saccharibacteria bacterium]
MSDTTNTPATFIGAPLDLGAENLGVDIGPDAFRYQKLVAKLRSAGLDVTDAGNIAVKDRAELAVGNPRLRYLEEIIRVNTALAEKTHQALTAGRKAIIIGGDHSVNLGAMAGASAAVGSDLGLIYFDAHGDMNTTETTLSGNIHGMHLASVMGFGAPELSHVYGDQVKLAKENLLHVAGSDWDQAELDLIKRENLKAFTLFDLLTQGLKPLIDLIDDLSSRVSNIWISLDLDSIDKIYAPGAGMPNAKGLTYREIATLAEYIGGHCNVIGIDVVEYNPLQDENNKTAELGIELIARFLGKDYSWYSNYMAQNQVHS